MSIGYEERAQLIEWQMVRREIKREDLRNDHEK
jgi:hypothetical protein